MEDGAPPAQIRSTKVIDTLRPDVAKQARDLLRRAAAHNIFLVVTSGFRSYEEQAKLFAKGRTRKGPKVTNAKPGQSWHNFGRAFDVAFLTPAGVVWEGPWDKVAELGKELGLEWGGDFTSIVDYPHFQNRGGMSLAQARYAKQAAERAERENERTARKLERQQQERDRRDSDR